jgi:hypothetical protein
VRSNDPPRFLGNVEPFSLAIALGCAVAIMASEPARRMRRLAASAAPSANTATNWAIIQQISKRLSEQMKFS